MKLFVNTQSRHEVMILALKARGYSIVPALGNASFTCWHRPGMPEYFFLGKSGGLRKGDDVESAKPCKHLADTIIYHGLIKPRYNPSDCEN